MLSLAKPGDAILLVHVVLPEDEKPDDEKEVASPIVVAHEGPPEEMDATDDLHSPALTSTAADVDIEQDKTAASRASKAAAAAERKRDRSTKAKELAARVAQKYYDTYGLTIKVLPPPIYLYIYRTKFHDHTVFTLSKLSLDL